MEALPARHGASGCLRHLAAAAVLLASAAYAQKQELIMPAEWIKGIDSQPTIGPDGPWQAILLGVGKIAGRAQECRGGGWNENLTADNAYPVWPTFSDNMLLFNANASGGWYASAESRTARGLGGVFGGFDDVVGGKIHWSDVVDDVQVCTRDLRQGRQLLRNDTTIATVFSAEGGYRFRTGLNAVGELGLSRMSRSSTSFLEGLFQEDVDALVQPSFGMHLGSAGLGLPGSFLFGGYDQARVLGPIGEWRTESGGPMFFLTDVILGVETGGSPFSSPGSISVYRGTEGNGQDALNLDTQGQSTQGSAADYTKAVGGRVGSAVVEPAPQFPYIYLPLGTCEEAAKHLPVRFDNALGLYLWNTDDDKQRFQTIVNSPAYMGFVLSDRNAKNITIKVPFKLLNLTLEPPIVPAGTTKQYFPCKPSNRTSWPLGRAFLQAAFLGMDLRRNVSYIAQAPGPDPDQSVHKYFPVDAAPPATEDAGAFARSWERHWTALPLENDTTVPPPPDEPLNGGLSVGAKAGIGAGVGVAALAAIVAGVLLWLRRKKKRIEEEAAAEDSKSSAQATAGTPFTEAATLAEADSAAAISEMDPLSSPKPELPGKMVSIEAEAGHGVSELGSADWRTSVRPGDHHYLYHELAGSEMGEQARRENEGGAGDASTTQR